MIKSILQITIMFVCVATTSILINGCGEHEQPTPTPIEPVVVLPDRLEVVSKSIRHEYNYARAMIIRDKDTGQEFIWIANSSRSVIISIGHEHE